MLVSAASYHPRPGGTEACPKEFHGHGALLRQKVRRREIEIVHMALPALAASKTGATENHRSRVIVLTAEPSGGLAWYVSELVAALAYRGTAVLLLCPTNFEYAAKARQTGAEVEYCPAREISYANVTQRILRNLKFSARTARALFRIMRPGDVVHFVSTLRVPFSLALFLPVSLHRGVSIVTAHGIRSGMSPDS
jgi:hypothetical protein